jgi:AhpD family alkylhydroperoxidase
MRIAYIPLVQKPFNALGHVSQQLRGGRLGHRLVDLVWLRASQINGCALCIDMHWRELIAEDADPRHLNAVAGWREAPFFNERERAALAWTELVTRIPQADPDDAAFAALKAQFSDEEIAELTFAIAVINAWNRLNVAMRTPPLPL